MNWSRSSCAPAKGMDMAILGGFGAGQGSGVAEVDSHCHLEGRAVTDRTRRPSGAGSGGPLPGL